ncbi:MAG: GNAT family N-acetyltransferase [Stackebrandtia sp.]
MRYVAYEPSPKDRPPRAALAVRLTDRVGDVAECARLSAVYNEEDPRTALVNAQNHVTQPRNALFVATNPVGTVVGYARVTWVGPSRAEADNAAPPGYYLGGMVVSGQYRRRGVGTRLTTVRLRFVTERANEAWYVVNGANDASIDLHVAHGFHETTRDFTFPGVVIDGPDSILCHKPFNDRAQPCQGCPTS